MYLAFVTVLQAWSKISWSTTRASKMSEMENHHIELLQLLSERLERLNVDSRWARRASGTRGEIIKVLDSAGKGGTFRLEYIDNLIQKSFDVLSKAAREIPDLDELRKKYGHSEG